MRLILSPVTWKRQKVGIFPGAVAVSGKEIEPIFFTLDVHVAAQKISRSIRSRSGRGLPSLVNVASVVSVARSVPVAVVDGGNEAGRDGFEGSRKVMGSPPWSCGRMASGARSRRGG